MSRTEFEAVQTAPPSTSLLVVLDGSPFAEQAVAPARLLAERLGIGVELVTTDRPLEVTSPGAVGDGHRLVCLATHGRNRTAGLAHSVSAAVVAASDGPVLLVGPAVSIHPPAAGGVAVCVDGTPDSEAIIPLALAWARALHVGARVLTVAEPVPESVRTPGHYPRLHGPKCDADVYVKALASAWNGDVAVTGQVIYDAVDVDGALADAFVADPPDLVVMGTRSPHGLRRLIFGSTAAALSHRSPAPVLVVPL
jgi:nucleotide-binding universal stress UspA family protein